MNIREHSAQLPSGNASQIARHLSASTQPTPTRTRQQYTLAEKLAIVRESLQAGVSQASITRKHNLGKNVLWSWRKSLSGFSVESLQGGGNGEPEVSNLRDRIAELERLLGQKSFEIELLRNRLQSRLTEMEIK